MDNYDKAVKEIDRLQANFNLFKIALVVATGAIIIIAVLFFMTQQAINTEIKQHDLTRDYITCEIQANNVTNPAMNAAADKVCVQKYSK